MAGVSLMAAPVTRTLYVSVRRTIAVRCTRGQAEGAGVDAADEEPWPFSRYPRAYPRPGRAPGDQTHDQRIAGHVQRHRERGTQPPRRDRGLSRAEIVRTAIAVADAEGPDAISMRRIARELNAGAMSLYWY